MSNEKQMYLRRLETILNSFNKIENRLSATDNLTDDLKIDSIDLVDIIIAIEDSFAVKFEDKEVYSVHTVGDIIQLIETKVNDNGK